MADVADIGVDEKDSERLMEAGILTPDDLIRLSSTAKAREAISRRTGIPSSALIRYRNQADLARVKGLGKNYLRLLQEAGIFSLEALAESDAAELAARLGVVAVQLKVRRPPSRRQVAAWIEFARGLPSILGS